MQDTNGFGKRLVSFVLFRVEKRETRSEKREARGKRQETRSKTRLVEGLERQVNRR